MLKKSEARKVLKGLLDTMELTSMAVENKFLRTHYVDFTSTFLRERHLIFVFQPRQKRKRKK